MPRIRNNKKRQAATGHIILVQEDRFRLRTEDGCVLLLTLPHESRLTLSEIEWLSARKTRVCVEYEGEANIDSAPVHSLRECPAARGDRLSGEPIHEEQPA